jgi:hypothetical protein
MAQKMGVSWAAYEDSILSLSPRRKVSVRPLVRG